LVADILREIAGWGEFAAAVEAVHSMPKQGVASSFDFGRSYGIVLGAVCSLAERIEHPAPGVWKRAMGVTADKETSRRKALDLWPKWSEALKLKRHGDRAEAALIARWLRDVVDPPGARKRVIPRY
jgi:hypothetical protein